MNIFVENLSTNINKHEQMRLLLIIKKAIVHESISSTPISYTFLCCKPS